MSVSGTDGEVLNGARSLVRTLIDSGVEVCFTNPGTSEIHFVAAWTRSLG
jgi:acetolactate synthase-1/2/3 large subunit